MKCSVFDAVKHYRYVIYARMSTSRQNERSPESQVAMIEERLRQLGYSWTQVKIYIDRAISGRYDSRRPEYQRMLLELRMGVVQADLVLVDTYDRFSRSKNGGRSRQNLERQGVLVLTANNSFADPTTMAGRILSAVEQERAREEGKIKGHQVRRGKREALRHGRWPGGPIPLGLRSKQDGSKRLEINPETGWLIVELFRIADTTGAGSSRIAALIKQDPRVVESVGELSSATIAEILQRPLYKGELVWNRQTGDIIDDVRVLKDVPENEWVRIPEFCEVLVPTAVWDRVNALRIARARPKAQRQAAGITGLCAPGIALKYPLSGIVICSSCGRAMTASSCQAYMDKQGHRRRYVYYGCPAYKQGRLCSNGRHVPEKWLRDEAFRILRDAIGLHDCESESLQLRQIIELARQAFARQESTRPNQRESLMNIKQTLESRVQGWSLSLGSLQLPQRVRDAMVRDWDIAVARIDDLANEITALDASERMSSELLDRDLIISRLKSFADILDGDNAAAASLMLAQHLQGIYCYPDGRCEVRVFMLGVLASELDFLSLDERDGSPEPTTEETDRRAIEPRRRTKRDARAAIHDDDVLDSANEFAVNPHRFDGMSNKFFTSHELQVPKPTSWARRNAANVASYREANQASMEELARHFEVSIPTLRAALRAHEEFTGLKSTGKLSSRTNKRNWAQLNASAVAEFMSQPSSTIRGAVTHFRRSEPTIRRALKCATGELN